MRLGFHISIVGGFKKVLNRAQKTKCQTIQLFSRNPRGWRQKNIEFNDCAIFRNDIKENGIFPVFVHLPYLANLGSSNERLLKRSVNSLIQELQRSEKLGAQFVIAHCGSNPVAKAGTKLMIESIIRAFLRVRNDVRLLIENTAGSGNEFGHNFEQLKEIIDGVGSDRIGIALDTAHVFQAGYDLRTKKAVNNTIQRIEKVLNIDRIHLIHFNDSLTELGSRKDRHWHVGKGRIGKGMRFIINHPALRHLPFIMETPRTSYEDDLMNMTAARNMITEA